MPPSAPTLSPSLLPRNPRLPALLHVFSPRQNETLIVTSGKRKHKSCEEDSPFIKRPTCPVPPSHKSPQPLVGDSSGCLQREDSPSYKWMSNTPSSTVCTSSSRISVERWESCPETQPWGPVTSATICDHRKLLSLPHPGLRPILQKSILGMPQRPHF